VKGVAGMSLQVLPFLEVFKDLSAGNVKTPQSEFLREGSIPVVDQGQQLIAGYVNDKSRICKVKPPIIIFGDHTRTIKYIGFEFAMGADGTKVLSPKIESDVKYLFYALQFIQIPAAGYSRHFKFLKEIEIPLPPLAEQKRIAAILDAADALRAKRHESLAELDNLLQSTFLHMFGDPLTNPMGWEIKNLSEVCSKITDGTHHSPPVCDSGIPYITAKHLKKDGLKFFASPWFISPKHHAEIFARCDPRPGDVLYIKDGATTGIAAVNRYDFEFSMLSSLALLRPSVSFIYGEYLCAYLNNDRNKTHLIENMGGAAIKRFTLAKIKKFRVPVPPLPLQHHFAITVQSIEQQKARMQAHLAELDALFASLQARAFNGKL
jgi:type I restriction enzyme S subunit